MNKYLVFFLVTNTAGQSDKFYTALSPELLSYRTGDSYSLRIPASQLDIARQLQKLARRAGQPFAWVGETEWTTADFDHGRLCILLPPEGPRLNEDDFIKRDLCPVCRSMLFSLTDKPHIRLDADYINIPPIFGSESGLVTCISSAAKTKLESGGLLDGAFTVPVEKTPAVPDDYFLLGSTIDLGNPVGEQYSGRCPNCDNPLEGSGFFAMYQHPARSGHVFHSHNQGPTCLLVTEKFARAAGRIAGDPDDALLSFVGWYPDDQDEARLPDLGSGDPSGPPSQRKER